MSATTLKPLQHFDFLKIHISILFICTEIAFMIYVSFQYRKLRIDNLFLQTIFWKYNIEIPFCKHTNIHPLINSYFHRYWILREVHCTIIFGTLTSSDSRICHRATSFPANPAVRAAALRPRSCSPSALKRGRMVDPPTAEHALEARPICNQWRLARFGIFFADLR